MKMDLSEFNNSNLDTCLIQSDVPESAKSKPCCMGIDEAGRGPVLGPLVYGICYCPIEDSERLAGMGFADSKTLSEDAREELFDKIDKNKDFIGWMIDIIPPTFISNKMLQRSKYSLNAISHDSAIGLVKQVLEKGANIQELYVDTVGDASKYEAKLSDIFPNIKVTVTPKADAKFPIVSAASICAKVARDRALKNWKFLENNISQDYGSGYPSDPNTKKWLGENIDPIFGFPQFVRFSWSTASNLLGSKAVSVEWEDDDEEDEDAKSMMPITSFFSNSQQTHGIKRHHFFKERQLEQVTSL